MSILPRGHKVGWLSPAQAYIAAGLCIAFGGIVVSPFVILNELYSTRVDVPKGNPRDSNDRGRIAVKFTALGGDVIGKHQCKKLQSFIMSIETAKDVGGLFELTTVR